MNVNDLWPQGKLHSTDPNWRPNNNWGKLLAVFETYLRDLARNDPGTSDEDVARWLALIRLGPQKKPKTK